MGFSVDGFDELIKDLDQLAKNAESLSGTHEVSLGELLTSDFIQSCSSYSSVDEMLNAGGFYIESIEDFEAIPEKELDAHISQTTHYASWEDMLGKATEAYVASKLGF